MNELLNLLKLSILGVIGELCIWHEFSSKKDKGNYAYSLWRGFPVSNALPLWNSITYYTSLWVHSSEPSCLENTIAC